MISSFFKIWIISYICIEYAAIAGKNHNQTMLWVGVAAAYFIIMRWFPPFRNEGPKEEEEN